MLTAHFQALASVSKAKLNLNLALNELLGCFSGFFQKLIADERGVIFIRPLCSGRGRLHLSLPILISVENSFIPLGGKAR